MPQFKKGSKAAKDYMAKIRSMKGKPGRKAKLKVYAKPTASGKIKPYVKKIGGFETTYKNAPADVKKIIDALDFQEDYAKLEKAAKALSKKGYYIDYSLDGSIIEFKKMPSKKTSVKKKVGAAKKMTKRELVKLASDYAYATSGNEERAVWNILDPDYTESLIPKYKAAIKAWEKKNYPYKLSGVKKPSTKHKDTKSHNVNIKVVSGYKIPKERIYISGSLMHKKKLSGIGKSETSYNVPPIKVLIQKRDIASLPKITSSYTAAQICRESILKTGLMQTQEVFGVLIMNNQNQVLGVYNHTIGTQNSTQLDVTLIATMIAKLAPKSAIIFHNHPSGSITPSQADRTMTTQIYQAFKLLGCNLLDSMVITEKGYFSFADEGLI